MPEFKSINISWIVLNTSESSIKLFISKLSTLNLTELDLIFNLLPKEFIKIRDNQISFS